MNHSGFYPMEEAAFRMEEGAFNMEEARDFVSEKEVSRDGGNKEAIPTSQKKSSEQVCQGVCEKQPADVSTIGTGLSSSPAILPRSLRCGMIDLYRVARTIVSAPLAPLNLDPNSDLRVEPYSAVHLRPQFQESLATTAAAWTRPSSGRPWRLSQGPPRPWGPTCHPGLAPSPILAPSLEATRTPAPPTCP